MQRPTAARPKLRISVIDGNTDTLTPMMLRGALDVIVCVQDDPRDNPLVIFREVISQEPVRLLAGASHPLVQKWAEPAQSETGADAGSSVDAGLAQSPPWQKT